MTDNEYEDRLIYHIVRAIHEGYDHITVESRLIEEAYARYISGLTSNGYRANQESEESLTKRDE